LTVVSPIVEDADDISTIINMKIDTMFDNRIRGDNVRLFAELDAGGMAFLLGVRNILCLATG
jgi:hypothetical protein